MPANTLLLKPKTQTRISLGELRVRALDRLYARRDAVQALIQALERYEDSRRGHLVNCVSISAGQK